MTTVPRPGRLSPSSRPPTAGKGLKKDLLKTTKRDDGSEQVTYDGHPLYRFADDQKAGDANGQGVDAFGAKWFVVDPGGKKITTTPKTNGGYRPSAGPAPALGGDRGGLGRDRGPGAASGCAV